MIYLYAITEFEIIEKAAAIRLTLRYEFAAPRLEFHSAAPL